MFLLQVITLTGAVMASAPGPEARSARTTATLPRPSRSEINLLLRAPERKVRSTDPKISAMLAFGAMRSATFAALLAAVDRTDVIAYIEPVTNLPPKLDGRLVLLPVTNRQRYLRIQVRADLSRVDLIPLIAHELWHALEVADAPEVRDEAGMIALYRRIGEPSHGAESYDTPGARLTGKQVRNELVG